MAVVLPAPLGPSRPKISPRRTASERSFTARTLRAQNPTRNVLARCSVSIATSIAARVACGSNGGNELVRLEGAPRAAARGPGGFSRLRRAGARSLGAALLSRHRPPLLSGQALHRAGSAARPHRLVGHDDGGGCLAARSSDAGPAPSLHAPLRGAALRPRFQAEPPRRPPAR